MSHDRDDTSSAITTLCIAAVVLLGLLVLLGSFGFYYVVRVRARTQQAMAAEQVARLKAERAVAAARATLSSSSGSNNSATGRDGAKLVIELDAECHPVIDGQQIEITQLSSKISPATSEVTIRCRADCSASLLADTARMCLEAGVRLVHVQRIP